VKCGAPGGNYDATNNPGGFISWANLLAQTRRHEYNSATESHYGEYSNSLTTNNPGDYIEARVAAPGVDLNAFDQSTRSGLDALYAQIRNATAVEPYAVNDSETGTFLGNINYQPYASCN
jgi:hypothetical protein